MSPISEPHAEVSASTLGIALDGAGWHPAAWRESSAQPTRLTSPAYWHELADRADRAGVDYVTIADAQVPGTGAHAGLNADVAGRTEVPAQAFSRPAWVNLLGEGVGGQSRPSSDTAVPADAATAGNTADLTNPVVGRLDALLTASWLAPRLQQLSVVPTVTVTHTEPFHVGTALQTLDHISRGQAGWQVRIDQGTAAALAFGKDQETEAQRDATSYTSEAAESVEVTRRLSDSWQDDAVIRDSATGRFIDGDRIHHINFTGEHFSVIGPSIVPRSPQGQLPVTLHASDADHLHLAAQVADVVYVTPGTATAVPHEVIAVRAAEVDADRAAAGLLPLRIVADLAVIIDTPDEPGRVRLARLNARAGNGTLGIGDAETGEAATAPVAAGSAAEIADLIANWLQPETGVAGIRLFPAVLPQDLDGIVEQLLPELRLRGLLPSQDAATATRTLRERFGLGVAENRYASAHRPGTVTEARSDTPTAVSAEKVSA